MFVADDPIWGDNGKVRALRPVDSQPPALWSSTASWIEADIPKRPWIVPGYLMIGSVTLISGAGSAGKSSIVKAWIAAAILNAPYSRFHPPRALRVLSYNVEDDREEEHRRISATLRQFDATPDTIAPNLMLVGPHDIGTLIERDVTGRIHLTAAMEELSALITEFKPDVVFLDPLVELHTSDENDNTGLRSVVASFRQLAREHKISVCILHHTRKGATIPGDPDASRGAGAIVGAARIVFTVCTMTDEEATELGIPKDIRKTFFRLDGAKMNYSLTGDPEWFQKVAYVLDNEESVAAAIPWSPPRHAATADDLRAILALIATASPPISPRLSATEPRSFAALCRRFDVNGRVDQAAALATLKVSYGVTEGQFSRPDRSKKDTAIGLRTADGMPDSASWV